MPIQSALRAVVADTNFAARRSIEVRRSLCLPRTSLCLPGASEHRGADTAGDAAAAGVHTRLSLDRHLDLVGGSLHARVLRFSIDRDRNSASASFTTGIRSSDGGGRCRSVQSSLASPGMSMDEIKVGEEAEGPAPAPAPAPAPGCVAAGCEPAAPVPAPAPAAVRVAEGVSPSSDRGDRDVNRELELAPRPAAVANAPRTSRGRGTTRPLLLLLLQPGRPARPRMRRPRLALPPGRTGRLPPPPRPCKPSIPPRPPSRSGPARAGAVSTRIPTSSCIYRI
eukprot:tig00021434_g21328.t1